MSAATLFGIGTNSAIRKFIKHEGLWGNWTVREFTDESIIVFQNDQYYILDDVQCPNPSMPPDALDAISAQLRSYLQALEEFQKKNEH